MIRSRSRKSANKNSPRDIAHTAKNHNWFAVVIDLLIVVIGVFLGLQANNWNEWRLDQQRAKSYHARLIEDLRQTERGAQASVAYYRQVRAHAEAALRAFDQPTE